MKNSINILVFFLTLSISFNAFCQENNNCQEDDYIALRALYLSTDGDNWFSADSIEAWPDADFFTANPTKPSDINVDEWFGVRVDSNSCVTFLDLDGVANFTSYGNSLGNNLVGIIPPELEKLSNLIFLSMWNSSLSGTIPPELGNLTNLQELYISFNYLLEGTIPSEIWNLTNLTRLSFHTNQLTGSIPSEVENLSELTYLNLRNNQLSGGIPQEIENLVNMEWLDLSENQLSGSIPTGIENLDSLELLHLNENQISGSIPMGIGNLSNLKQLELENNQLNGSIPPGLGNLVDLSRLHLYNNQLSGCYAVDIMPLCEQLYFSSNTNERISDGNNFDAPWEDFCATGAGTCTVDIDNTHQSTFTVYPIPAKDVVIFDVPNIASADELILYDITGREISRQAFPQDKQLAVSHLNDGVYIYRIFYENEVYSGKIVVE